MKSRLVGLAVAVATLGLFGSSFAAHADTLSLTASSSGSITFNATSSPSGTVSVTFTTLTGIGVLDGTTGTYTIGVTTPSPFGTATKTGEGYAVSAVTAPFTFIDSSNPSLDLSGTITLTFIRDDSTNPTFFGTFSGSGLSGLEFDMTTTTIPNVAPSLSCQQSTPGHLVTCLDSLIAAKGSASVGISSGEIEGIPFPATGAGLPGLVAACIGLLFLGHRRRRQLVA